MNTLCLKYGHSDQVYHNGASVYKECQRCFRKLTIGRPKPEPLREISSVETGRIDKKPEIG